MLQTLIKNWWLLALRGLFALLFSISVFLTRSSAETYTLRPFATKGVTVFLGILAVVAGACTVAAGIWRAATGKWWLLVADGALVIAAGLTLILVDGVAFTTVTQAVVVLAVAIGFLELSVARSLRRHLPDEWILALAGIGSVGFALAFLLLKTEEIGPMFIWLGAFSGFSAVCMLALAFRLRRLRTSIHRVVHPVPETSRP
jgi:uncharacterized membrane protein HdeD (DUF308 family)